MNIALITPAAARARTGNRHTALRWAAFLRAAGHRVTVSQVWRPDSHTDLLLALHARRSHASIRAFHARHPSRPLVLALTGTDLYRDIHESAQARESLEMAHAFIVLQAQAIESLPARLRERASVVVQSCATRLRHAPLRRGFRVCVIGHLREEKDPLRAAAALRHLSRDLPIEIIQLGEALDPRLAAAARAMMRRDARYVWLGGLPHHRALRWLASSHAMVISSRMEGGANVVSEAIRIGVPIIASRIPGNLGLLGRDYPACFRTGSDLALARLLQRAAADLVFYRQIRQRVRGLRASVAPRAEARALLAAISRARCAA